MNPYPPEIEQEMKKFHGTLSEKDKRRYAAIEALKLGHGGIVYMASLLGCDRNTVSDGIKELKDLPTASDYTKRIRKAGGGRKPYDESYPDIDRKFLDVIAEYTAGDPMDGSIIWTNLSPQEIADRLADRHDIRVSDTVIRQLLDKHNYRLRQIQKKTTMKDNKDRNAQFENISRLKSIYEAANNPVMSMDTKKKEALGNFYRAGKLYTQDFLEAYDHDFKSFAKGVVIPHSLYDLMRNKGYISLGTSKDTSEFACDSLRNWWYHQGQYDYPQASSILILCDGGGSNDSRHYVFKADLQKLVDEIGVEIRIAHYPPYTSKYNPIEHRLFPHVTRACQGVIFKTLDLVKQLMERTHTRTGLTVTVQIIDKIYQIGRKVAQEFKDNMPILFDEYLPQWNYRAVPNAEVI